MTERERKRWGEVVDDAYQRFVRVVAQGRRLSLDEVKAIADGKVYTAPEALRHNLIDEIGYLDDAILQAQRDAHLEAARVIRYSRQTPLETLLGMAAPKPSPQLDADLWLRLQTPRILFLAR
jgi:protease-4